MSKGKRYTDEFKKEAVKQVIDRGIQLSCSYIDYKVHLSSYPHEALADDNRLTLSLCVLDKENDYVGECNLIWDRSSQEMYQQC